MKEFQLQGINHLALVCQDMGRTVDFYTNTLGLLDLIKTIALPNIRQLGDIERDLQHQPATVAELEK